MDFGRESGNQQIAEQIVFDHREAPLDEADRALCDFAVKLTLHPAAMSADDVQELRRHGFQDEAILIATQVIAYFNYINRIADALEVDHEPWMSIAPEQWRARKARFDQGGHAPD